MLTARRAAAAVQQLAAAPPLLEVKTTATQNSGLQRVAYARQPQGSGRRREPLRGKCGGKQRRGLRFTTDGGAKARAGPPSCSIIVIGV